MSRSERDRQMMREIAEESDRERGAEIIGINLALAGLCRTLAVMDDRELVWELGFFADEELAGAGARFAAEHARIIELNPQHHLYITEPSEERLREVRTNLMKGFGRDLAEYRPW